MRNLIIALLTLLTTTPSLAGTPISRRLFLESACVSTFLSGLPTYAVKPAPTGLQWEIVGPNSKRPVFQGAVEDIKGKTAGEVTVQILDAQGIPYVGNESGIHSILGTPTGDDAIVIESDDTMRVYGWCYEVDGVQPDVMPDKFVFEKPRAALRWFYAFSLYEKGEWTAYCVPAYTKPLERRPVN